jgi:hypothetical protein
MKTFITILIVISSFFSFSQELAFRDMNQVLCDSNYVLDYRKIYDDYLTPIDILIETRLEERYGYYVNYIQGDINDPENAPITRVCVVEKIFQTINLNDEYNKFVKKSREVSSN